MLLRKKLTSAEATAYVVANRKLLSRLYFEDDMTARQVAETQNIYHDDNFAKALFRVLGGKGKGLGGARPGCGNKKGVRFCKVCGKVYCICEDGKTI